MFYPETKPTRRLIRQLPRSQQPAQRLARVGADQLSLIELIAVVLNTPDALDLAQEVVSRFTISGLPHVTQAELQKLYGIGPIRAARLLAAIELGRRLLHHTEKRPKIKSPADAAVFLIPQLAKREEENFVVLLLGTNNALLNTTWLYKGTVNCTSVRVGEVFREAIRRQAAAIIVAHNHPAETREPSPEDIEMTRLIYDAGCTLNIPLLDHLIITSHGYTSIREKTELFEKPS